MLYCSIEDIILTVVTSYQGLGLRHLHKSYILPRGVSIAELADIEDHFLHVIAIRPNLKFANLNSTEIPSYIFQSLLAFLTSQNL